MVAASAPVSASIIKAPPYVLSRVSNPSYPTPLATLPALTLFFAILARIRMEIEGMPDILEIHSAISKVSCFRIKQVSFKQLMYITCILKLLSYGTINIKFLYRK